MTKKQDLVNWEKQMAAAAKAVAKTERTSTGNFNVQSGVLQYNGEPVADNKTQGIVIASVFEHVWYTDRWSKDDPKPPACFALGVPDNEGNAPHMTPHPNVIKAPSDVCGDCPNFKWNSDPNGPGKWCKEKRRLMILPPSDSEEDIAGSEIAKLTLPVTSVKRWGNYVNQTAMMHGRPFWAVVTEISVKPDPKYQFTINFDIVAPVPLELLGALQGRLEQAINLGMEPYDLSPKEAPQEAAESDKY